MRVGQTGQNESSLRVEGRGETVLPAQGRYPRGASQSARASTLREEGERVTPLLPQNQLE